MGYKLSYRPITNHRYINIINSSSTVCTVGHSTHTNNNIYELWALVLSLSDFYCWLEVCSSEGVAFIIIPIIFELLVL